MSQPNIFVTPPATTDPVAELAERQRRAQQFDPLRASTAAAAPLAVQPSAPPPPPEGPDVSALARQQAVNIPAPRRVPQFETPEQMLAWLQDQKTLGPMPQRAGPPPTAQRGPMGGAAPGGGGYAPAQLHSLTIYDERLADEVSKYQQRRQRVIGNEGGRFGDPRAVRALMAQVDSEHKENLAGIQAQRNAWLQTYAGMGEEIEQIGTERARGVGERDVALYGTDIEAGQRAMQLREQEGQAIRRHAAETQRQLADAQAHSDTVVKELDAGWQELSQVKPATLETWRNKNAGMAVLGGIAVALGAVQQAMTGDTRGVDRAMAGIRQGVQDEIDAQERDLDRKQRYLGAKQSMLSLYQAKIGNIQTASDMARVALGQSVLAEMEQGKMSAAVSQAGVNGDALKRDVQLMVDEDRRKMLQNAEARRLQENQARAGAAAAQQQRTRDAALARTLGQELSEKDLSRYLDTEGLVRQGSDVKVARDDLATAREQRANFSTLEAVLSKVKPGEIMSPEEAAIVAQLSARVAMPDMIAAFGAGNEKQIEIAKGMAGIPPTQWTDRMYKDVTGMVRQGAAITGRRFDQLRAAHVEPGAVTEIVDPLTGKKRVFIKYGEQAPTSAAPQIKPGVAR